MAIIADFWQRSSLKHAALAREVPLREYATYEDATSWFAAALNELESKGILTGFLDAMAARARTKGSDPNLLGS